MSSRPDVHPDEREHGEHADHSVHDGPVAALAEALPPPLLPPLPRGTRRRIAEFDEAVDRALPREPAGRAAGGVGVMRGPVGAWGSWGISSFFRRPRPPWQGSGPLK